MGGYLLGSVPFGLVLVRLAGLGDIRAIGSGNIGATNVLRTGNKGLALATLVLDGGKGAIAVLIARYVIGEDAVAWAGFAAVLGHNFPVWLGFKGGKGVATTLGTLMAASWPVGIGCCLTWVVVAALFRISSLSALVALAAAPIYAYYASGPDLALMAAGMTVLGFIRHHQNIKRLLHGEEPKIGTKKPEFKPMLIPITSRISIDDSELEFAFVRSSGPGGQNVNKLSTAVQLRFDVRNSPSLPDAVRHRMERLAGRRLTQDGILVIAAQRFRSQEQNRHDAMERLTDLIRDASIVPVVRRPTKPTAGSRRRRLEAKSNRSTIKSWRGRPNETD